MKNYLFIAVAMLLLASCATDDSIEDASGEASSKVGICFDSGTGAVTRAVKTGSEAANALNNSITVFGYKTEVGGTKRTVFDYYTVQYIPGSAATGTANTANWQYAGLSMRDLTGAETGATQVTKYWDYAASQFDFIAFSKGTATDVIVSTIDNTAATPTYELKGTTSELMKMYVADRVTAKANATVIANRQYPYGSPIQFNFSALGAKVRIGFYETIKGYSVKDVKFYVGTNTQSQSKPILTAASDVIPSGNGTVTVTFPVTDASSQDDYNKVKTTFEGAMANTVQFGDLVLKGRDVSEQEGNYYLGREATSPALSGYTAVVPTDAGELTLKVDYTLVARDGDGETIAVEGVTATIPAEHTHWQSNYAYTYIFKITDNGLTPITFDALETQTADGQQETITTIGTPAITTYAKGAVGSDYYGGDNIYVSVEGKTLTDSNLKLYTVTTSGTTAITEDAVSKRLAGTSNGLTVTAVASTAADKLTIVTEIAAADSPDGNAISGSFGKFTAQASKTYAVEYIDGSNKYYKVIKVAAGTRP